MNENQTYRNLKDIPGYVESTAERRALLASAFQIGARAVREAVGRRTEDKKVLEKMTERF